MACAPYMNFVVRLFLQKTVHDLFLEIDTDGSEELDANELDTVGLFVKNWLLKGTPAHELGPMVGISASAVGITAKARLNYKSFERWYFEAGLQRRLRDLQERNKDLQTTRDMAVRSLQKLEPHPKGTVAHCEACIEKLQREVEEIDERVEEVHRPGPYVYPLRDIRTCNAGGTDPVQDKPRARQVQHTRAGAAKRSTCTPRGADAPTPVPGSSFAYAL